MPRPDFGIAETAQTIRTLKVLKRPTFQINSTASVSSGSGPSRLKVNSAESTRRPGALTSLQPILPCNQMNVSGIIGRSSRVILPPSSKGATLRSLPPPPTNPASRPPPSDPTTMKTILTTHVAQATDPRTENGVIQLMSIFLPQNGYMSPMEREMRRGLEQSPEKNGKGKVAKYLRCVQHNSGCSICSFYDAYVAEV